eukprot:symbB.v1.2.000190.t2/scaffold21.1/size436794/9
MEGLNLDKKAKEVLSEIPEESQEELLDELKRDHRRVRNHSAFIISNVKRVKDGSYRSRYRSAPDERNGDDYGNYGGYGGFGDDSQQESYSYWRREHRENESDGYDTQGSAEIRKSLNEKALSSFIARVISDDTGRFIGLDTTTRCKNSSRRHTFIYLHGHLAAMAETPEEDENVQATEELTQKIIELTKALVFLYTRQDGHDARLASLKDAKAKEVEQVTTWATEKVESHQHEVSEVSKRLTGRVEDLERKYAQRVREAKSSIEELKDTLQKKQKAADAMVALWRDVTQRRQEALQVRQEAEELRRKLQSAEARAGCDEQWLVRQIAAETQRGRLELERRFEESSKELKTEHAQMIEQLRGQRELRITELRRSLEEERQEATAQAEEALQEAVKRQELSFQVERVNLEAAREEVLMAKAQCEERQRVLDEMSRELQERKRHGQMMSKEADLAHGRKLRQENDGRELRRKKIALERSLGVKAAAYAENDGATQRAVQTLSDDLRQGMAQLEELRGELARKKRQVQERQALVEERELRSEQLSEDLTAERKRSDEMQRVLLRLEQGAGCPE